MVETARELGHDYLVITDHSPRLTVANGLSPERLRAQLRAVAELNETLVDSGFRVLTGIEVDILEDGWPRPGTRPARRAGRRGRERAQQAADAARRR